jgi:hypothetical protein
MESVGKDEEELSTRQQWYVPPILSPTNKHPQKIHSAMDFLRRCFRRQFATGLISRLQETPTSVNHRSPNPFH